jgi:hypothetical protein
MNAHPSFSSASTVLAEKAINVHAGDVNRNIACEHQPDQAERNECASRAIDPPSSQNAYYGSNKPHDRIDGPQNWALHEEIHRCEGSEQNPPQRLRNEKLHSLVTRWQICNAIERNKRSDIQDKPHRREQPCWWGNAWLHETVIKCFVAAYSCWDHADQIGCDEDRYAMPNLKPLRIHFVAPFAREKRSQYPIVCVI